MGCWLVTVLTNPEKSDYLKQEKMYSAYVHSNRLEVGTKRCLSGTVLTHHIKRSTRTISTSELSSDKGSRISAQLHIYQEATERCIRN